MGFDRRGLGELDVDVSAGTDAGPLALTPDGYAIPIMASRRPGSRSAQNTSGLFGSVAWRESRVAPELTVFCDVGAAPGVYAEAAVTLPVFASPEPAPPS